MEKSVKRSNSDLSMVSTLSEVLDLTVLVKLFTGIFQILVSVIIFLSINSITIFELPFSRELLEDKNDYFANLILDFWHGIHIHTKYFVAAYLLIHGLVNIFIFLIVWKHKIRLYPAAITVLIIMVIYQCYRFLHSFSIFLYAITLVDIIIIILILLQYDDKRRRFYTHKR